MEGSLGPGLTPKHQEVPELASLSYFQCYIRHLGKLEMNPSFSPGSTEQAQGTTTFLSADSADPTFKIYLNVTDSYHLH